MRHLKATSKVSTKKIRFWLFLARFFPASQFLHSSHFQNIQQDGVILSPPKMAVRAADKKGCCEGISDHQMLWRYWLNAFGLLTSVGEGPPLPCGAFTEIGLTVSLHASLVIWNWQRQGLLVCRCSDSCACGMWSVCANCLTPTVFSIFFTWLGLSSSK